jgi:hypothetical protein
MQFNFSDPRLIIGVVVVLAVIVIVVALAARARHAKTEALKNRFGPEYERAVKLHGRKAEAQLSQREARVERMKLVRLTAAARERYLNEWQTLQMRFVDHPKTSVAAAEELVSSLMADRGYPEGSFEQRCEDISVYHPQLVEHYRTAHGVATRVMSGEASTEELRTAMIQYRALFDELIGEATPVEMRTSAAA